MSIFSQSLREAVLMITDETFWLPLSLVADSVRGHCAFNQVFGTSFLSIGQSQRIRPPTMISTAVCLLYLPWRILGWCAVITSQKILLWQI